jgi:hypothetical protein
METSKSCRWERWPYSLIDVGTGGIMCPFKNVPLDEVEAFIQAD